MEHSGRDLLAHPLSLAGAALATITGVLIAVIFVASLLGWEGSPYLGVLAFVILPSILVLALLLIPAGLYLARRRRAQLAAGEATPHLPIVDLNKPHTRILVLGFLALTTVNVLLLAGASYKGLEVMDSPAFCGSCHSVMDPERTAHARSPHARVRCVECHIGPGASWFVKSKLSGAWQLVSVNLNLYPRPIPTPVKNLRPARDTCEQCHWPAKFVGDRLKVMTRHADDAASTPTKTALLLHIGGLQGSRTKGIHWHVAEGVRVRYLADPKREKIGPVELTDSDGSRRDYEIKGEQPKDARWREMDCVDCHNRPTHVYRLPAEEVDDAIEAGHIARTLPFIRREAVKALQVEYPSAEAARAGIRAQLSAFYAKEDPARASERLAAVDAAGAALGDIWARNVWPKMNIKWGTYPSFLGHEAAPGCFRCHDGEHTTRDGRAISQDCDLCHQLVAQDEKDPAALRQLAGSR
ncbi:MAG TPA: NapC/NirT family cytochrome c [Anaeromyxobacteraceae bacterium]|jgi:hypothetical protein|nr:NapC/NirT family cytochrome c [Anaeromyxobacteraceae bacterium]